MEISQKNLQFEEKYRQDNQQKDGMRVQMAQLEKKLRELQREIATTNLENETLKSILGGEQELREDRSVEETNALLVVNDDLKQHAVTSEEEKKKVKKQREFTETQGQLLEKTASEAKQRVQDLTSHIAQSRQQTNEQIARLEQDLRALLNENKSLKSQKDKYELLHKQLERDVGLLIQSEKQLESDWTKRVNDIERDVTEKRNEVQQTIEQL